MDEEAWQPFAGFVSGLRHVAIAAAWLLAAAAIFWYGGLGGWQFGWLTALAVTVGGGVALAAITWPRAVGRGLWLAGYAVLGAVVAVVSATKAPASAPRLTDRLDHVHPAFFRTISTRSSGHGWCLPSCPTVERRYASPALGPRPSVVNLAAALRAGGLLPHLGASLADPLAPSISGGTGDVRVVISYDRTATSPTVVVTLRSVRL